MELIVCTIYLWFCITLFEVMHLLLIKAGVSELVRRQGRVAPWETAFSRLGGKSFVAVLLKKTYSRTFSFAPLCVVSCLCVKLR